MNVERMEKALHEVWKYYDEAGETGENYELDPDNLAKFAADLCKEYSKYSYAEGHTMPAPSQYIDAEKC